MNYYFRAVLVMLLIPTITMITANFSFSTSIDSVAISVVNDDNGNLGSGYLSFLSPNIMSLVSLNAFIPFLGVSIASDSYYDYVI